MRIRSFARLLRRFISRPAKVRQGPPKARQALAALTARPTTGAAAAFGSNPGALQMQVYAPPRLPAGRPLIVVLHGCGQTATTFAADAGWTALADEARLALLLPAQIHENNRGGCFNWFLPRDTRRGAGEAMSIRQMVRTATERFGSDPGQIFVVGFSAGAAMAASLLAAYPAVFAAGGVVAGMPVGCATSAAGAILRMRRADTGRTRQALAADVRSVTGSVARKSWPRLSIWHGERDRTVDPDNAEVLAKQWSELQGFDAEPSSDRVEPGLRQRAWGRPNRPPAVELWTIAGLGHGFPVDASAPGRGRAGAWVTDSGLCAARRIAAFWGLCDAT